jgi:hypothetical protein
MPITVSGTAITFNDATTQTTAFTGGGGTVTSVATGNGLQGGTITTSGTLSVACPAFNTVGSYCFIAKVAGLGSIAGTNYAAGASSIQSGSLFNSDGLTAGTAQNNLSGTWKWMGANAVGGVPWFADGCRVS